MPAERPELLSLGSRLREARLKKNDTQAMFAARIGVSIPTLRRMEAGDPAVQIGHWVAALDILDRSSDLAAILAPTEDLFAKYEAANAPARKRARIRST